MHLLVPGVGQGDVEQHRYVRVAGTVERAWTVPADADPRCARRKPEPVRIGWQSEPIGGVEQVTVVEKPIEQARDPLTIGVDRLHM